MTLDDAYECFHDELAGYLRKTFRDEDIAEDAAQQAFSRAAFSLLATGSLREGVAVCHGPQRGD